MKSKIPENRYWVNVSVPLRPLLRKRLGNDLLNTSINQKKIVIVSLFFVRVIFLVKIVFIDGKKAHYIIVLVVNSIQRCSESKINVFSYSYDHYSPQRRSANQIQTGRLKFIQATQIFCPNTIPEKLSSIGSIPTFIY